MVLTTLEERRVVFYGPDGLSLFKILSHGCNLPERLWINALSGEGGDVEKKLRRGAASSCRTTITLVNTTC